MFVRRVHYSKIHGKCQLKKIKGISIGPKILFLGLARKMGLICGRFELSIEKFGSSVFKGY